MRVATRQLSIFLLACVIGSAGPLETTLAKMDQAAAGFTGVAADVRKSAYNSVLKMVDVESGRFLMKRAKSRDIHVLFDIKDPEPKQYAMDLHKLEIYLPKIQTVQEYEVGRYKSLAEELLLLGFGTTSKELSSAYTVSLGGPETIGNEKTTRLELIPKSKEMLAHLTKVDLWISDATGLPTQQKFYTPGGNYNLATYSNVMSNPNLPDSAVKLNSKGAKREYPLK